MSNFYNKDHRPGFGPDLTRTENFKLGYQENKPQKDSSKLEGNIPLFTISERNSFNSSILDRILQSDWWRRRGQYNWPLKARIKTAQGRHDLYEIKSICSECFKLMKDDGFQVIIF